MSASVPPLSIQALPMSKISDVIAHRGVMRE